MIVNDNNKISEIDLNSELLGKINATPSNMETHTLYADNWEEISDSDSDMQYYYVLSVPKLLDTSFVNIVFDSTDGSRELALDYGLCDEVYVVDGAIRFLAEDLPEHDLNITVYYIL